MLISKCSKYLVLQMAYFFYHRVDLPEITSVRHQPLKGNRWSTTKDADLSIPSSGHRLARAGAWYSKFQMERQYSDYLTDNQHVIELNRHL